MLDLAIISMTKPQDAYLVPIALDIFGMRGAHVFTLLKDFATLLIKKPSGCSISLLQGLFALLSPSVALKKTLLIYLGVEVGIDG